MKKVLFYGDSPTVATGFGTVSRNVLGNLFKTGKYIIDIFGINYHGMPHSMPYQIWPAADHHTGDPYGRRKFCHFAIQHDFDILFVIQDTFIVDFLPELIKHLKENRNKPFRTIMYYPIDSVLKPKWYNNIKVVDRLVAYTEFGKEALLEHDPERKVDVIYHGANVEDFYIVPEKDVKDFRRHFFRSQADKFIFTNTNRNQQRKDIPRTMMAFKEFKKVVPDSILYLHMAKKDQGWDLPEVCNSMGLSTSTDVIFPEEMEPNQGYPISIVNMLYNCSDCLVSTVLGEGFGLCVHPDTNVYTEQGIKPIKALTVEDNVLSSDGTYNAVQHIMTKNHDEDIYEINTWMSNIPIKTSKDHGFYVKDGDNYIWKKAEDLNIGDLLLFPKNVITSDIDNDFGLDLDGISQDDKYLLLPIKSINVYEYKGKLIDIQVEHTNNFVAENVIVHNSWLEAMAVKTPVIMPNNTAMKELITEDKGYLADCGTNSSLWTCVPNDNDVLRPLVDVNDMVSKMLHVYNNYEEAKDKAKNAYKWIHEDMLWSGKIAKQWEKVFSEEVKALSIRPIEVKPKSIESEEF